MSGSEIELQVLKTVVEKLDTTLDRVVELTNDISKILAVQEQRMGSLEREAVDTKAELRELERKIYYRMDDFLTSFHEIKNTVRGEIKEGEKVQDVKFERIEKRIEILESFKWKAIGIITAVTFVVSQLPKFIPFL